MKYYLHDTSAFDDEKVSELFINFGYEGVGLFYVALEKLAKQEKPIKTDVLKKQLRIGKRLEKCWEFMESLGILSSNNGETFNKQLLNFSEKYQIKKEKTREKVSQWRSNQQNAESVTDYVPICNPSKGKESKVNIKEEGKSELHSPPPPFEMVNNFFIENGYSNAQRFYTFYSEKNWTDTHGNKVNDWQKKARLGWFKSDAKTQPTEVFKARRLPKNLNIPKYD